MPWKNGGGETAEIAVHPEGASLSDFHWRLSMATVATDGPFSSFSGIDRTLAVLEGEGIVLEIAGRPPATLTRDETPLAFPGDVAVTAHLVDGAVRDLNLMTRRGSVTHTMKRLDEALTELRVGPDATALIFCAVRDVTIEAAEGPIDLARHDTAIVGAGTYRIRLAPGAMAFLCTVDTLS